MGCIFNTEIIYSRGSTSWLVGLFGTVPRKKEISLPRLHGRSISTSTRRAGAYAPGLFVQ